jgi:hypothetical protein
MRHQQRTLDRTGISKCAGIVQRLLMLSVPQQACPPASGSACCSSHRLMKVVTRSSLKWKRLVPSYLGIKTAVCQRTYP